MAADDDLTPHANMMQAQPLDLARLSTPDLERRIGDLEGEIAGLRAEIQKRAQQKSLADSLFKPAGDAKSSFSA